MSCHLIGNRMLMGKCSDITVQHTKHVCVCVLERASERGRNNYKYFTKE